MKPKPPGYDEFEEWLTRGAGESMLGGIIKSAAAAVKRKLNQRLSTPNLFPHIEHEDRAELDKAQRAWGLGDKMVRRGRARTETINGILDADAGLRITADDLDPPSPHDR